MITNAIAQPNLQVDLPLWGEFKRLWGGNRITEGEFISEKEYKIQPFFSQSLSLNNSAIGIIDQRTMRYLYISDNANEVMHQDVGHCLEKGVSYSFSKIVPEEQVGIIAFSKIIVSYFRGLSEVEREKYQHYWDYRVLKPDGGKIRLLQRDRVLNYEEDGQISTSLIVLSDITNYKQDGTQHLRLTNGKENTLYQFSTKEQVLKKLDEPSCRELEIAKLINKGLSRKQIADQLNLSYHTVTTHCKNLSKKLNVHDAIGMVNLLKIIGLL